MYKIQLLCNFTGDLYAAWKHMLPSDSQLRFIANSNSDADPDWYVVINSTSATYDPKRTIQFIMEPYGYKAIDCAYAQTHSRWHNNIEWHLSLTYDQLLNTVFIDKPMNSALSVIISPKKFDPGHILRHSVLQELLESKLDVHVYGYRQPRGELPLRKKDAGLIPYKYTYNCENNSIPNYFTEKLTDAIMTETLCFYNGHKSVMDWIDHRAYVFIDSNNPREIAKKIQHCITQDIYENRLPFIRAAKLRILTRMSLEPRLLRIIESLCALNCEYARI